MPKYCVALNCSRYQRHPTKDPEGRTITFHKFPKDPHFRQRWVLALHRRTENGELWQPTEHSSLCSLHFTEDCMDRTGQTVRLWRGAVPTVFNNPHSEQEAASKAHAQDTEHFWADGNLGTGAGRTPSKGVAQQTLPGGFPNGSTNGYGMHHRDNQCPIDLTGEDPFENNAHNGLPSHTATYREDSAAPLREPSFICDECGRSFTGYWHFMQHVENHEKRRMNPLTA